MGKLDPQRRYWTVAYREPSEPLFHRVELNLTWNQSVELTRHLYQVTPDLEIWFVSNRRGELDGYVQVEDVMNLMEDDGTRVPMTDDGQLPFEVR